MIPLVLLPGLGSDAALWAHQSRDLADIAETSVGDTLQDDGLPAMAERVLASAPPRFALAGLSMGGYLAFEIMRRSPERVLRLALLDTSARPDTPEQTETRRQAIAASERYDFAALARASLVTLVAPDAPEDVRDAVVAMSVRVGPDAYRRQQRAIMERPDSRPTLGAIAVPTLVLVGEEDRLTPPPVAQEIADGVPGVTLARIAGSGHLPALERPNAVTNAMRRWLAG